MLSNLRSPEQKGPGTCLSLAVWVVYSNQETQGWTPHLRGWGKVTKAHSRHLPTDLGMRF